MTDNFQQLNTDDALQQVQEDQTAQEEQPLSEGQTVQDTQPSQSETTQHDIPKDPKRKNGWLGTVIFVIVIVLSLFLMYQLSQKITTGEKSLAEIIKGLRVEYLCLAVAAVIVIMFVDSLKYFIIMKATVSKASYKIALKTALLGKYYDFITPFSSGGQPFQIHYLYKKGYSGGESTAIIFAKYCFNILLWLLICLLLMVCNRDALTTYIPEQSQRQWFTVFGWIGFGVNCLFPLFILAFALFPKLMETVTRWFLTIGSKLNLIKDKESIVQRAKRTTQDFRSVFTVMLRKPLHTILLILCCIIEPLLGMMLPYFVVVALAGNSVVPSAELMFAIMTLNVYVSMSVTIVPTPGNSGAMENAFILILTSVAEGVLFWSALTWRFLSYYLYVIIGLIMVICDFVRNHRAAKIDKTK